MAADTEKAKKIRMYRNGDDKFCGKQIVLNKRRIKTFDAFLSTVTSEVKYKEAARSIRTPNHGTRVVNLDDLQEENAYVVCGAGPFRRIR